MTQVHASLRLFPWQFDAADGILSESAIANGDGEIVDQKELAERLPAQAKEQSVSPTGPGGLLSQFTKNVPGNHAGEP